jgi:calpain-15
MDSQVICKEIYPGVLVNQQTFEDGIQEFLVDNKRYNTLKFEADFSNSTNIHIENTSSLKVTCEILPKKTHLIARVFSSSTSLITVKFRFNLSAPPAEMARQLIIEDNEEIMKKLRKSSKIFKTSPMNKLSIEEITSQLGGCNFVDPDFSPSDSSVYAGSSAVTSELIHWRRPGDIFTEGFSLFSEDLDPNDLRPGQLQDFWFLSALATLAERPQAIKRLFCSEEVNKEGIYRMRLCKGGEWAVVTVDDYFPCFPQGHPMFSWSYSNDIWVLLLEKAYAKLHGSYMLLEKGLAHEGLLDLTGIPSELLDFSSKKGKELIEKNTFWHFLCENDQAGTLISASCSLESSNLASYESDLVPGYSYTILQLETIGTQQVLQLRNPFGTFNWQGDWSRNSKNWTKEALTKLNPSLEEDDGTFFISFSDFLERFTSVSLCRLRTFYESRVHGRFYRVTIGERKSVISKFYYCLEISEPCKLFIALHQEDERVFGVENKRAYLDVGLVILKRASGDQPEVFAYRPNCIKREVDLEVDLEAGSYIILPRTTGCKLRRPTGANSEFPSLLLDKQLHPLFLSTIKDIFRKFDITMNGELDYHEFKSLLETCGESISQKDFDGLRAVHCSGSVGLTQEGLVSYFKEVLHRRSDDIVWDWLNALGYDRDFFSVKSRVFVLTVHSLQRLKLTVRDATDSNLDKISTLILLKKFGRKKNDQPELDLLSLVETDAAAFTYGVFNKLEDKTIKPTLDCSKAKGVLISTMNDVITVTLPPKTGEVLAHFVRVDENFDFRVNFAFSQV